MVPEAEAFWALRIRSASWPEGRTDSHQPSSAAEGVVGILLRIFERLDRPCELEFGYDDDEEDDADDVAEADEEKDDLDEADARRFGSYPVGYCGMDDWPVAISSD